MPDKIKYSEQAKLMLEKMGKNIDVKEVEKFYLANFFQITGGVILHYLELKAEKRLDKNLKIIQ